MSFKNKLYISIAIISVPIIIMATIEDQKNEKDLIIKKSELKAFLCSDPNKPNYSILIEEQLNGEFSVSELFNGALSGDSRYFITTAYDGTNPKIKTYVFRHNNSSAFVEITKDGKSSYIFEREIAVTNFPLTCVPPKK